MLLSMSLAMGAVNGYQVAVTEATSLASQHVFRKHKFIERVRRSYAGHRLRGRACFASIADQGGAVLMEKTLWPIPRVLELQDPTGRVGLPTPSPDADRAAPCVLAVVDPRRQRDGRRHRRPSKRA